MARTTQDLLARHAELTTSLSELIGEAGQIRAAITLGRADTWHNNNHLPVTERKETVSHAVASLLSDLQDIESQMEQCRVELHHLDAVLPFSSLFNTRTEG